MLTMKSIGVVKSTKAVYDRILELHIANTQIIINHVAAFLEENKYYNKNFKDSFFFFHVGFIVYGDGAYIRHHFLILVAYVSRCLIPN